ncbi:Homeodomain GLABROUS 2 [Heracleum sosnowskyi]|uniref:Homeodomain GLABROUS 2 n=1 Tax=Heracleum sosnowskyi TaxID=360622 RepID=A0AAD8IU03_9APIA|nr:Homeodomain GLABROUS 2 [Heracleum sosnowskyi]
MQKSSSTISINKGCSSRSRVMADSSAEESGWTLYFEDLLNDSNNMNTEYFDHEEKHSLLTSSDNEISSSRISLVSDAASSASVVGFSLRTSCTNLSFKKKRSCIVYKGSSMASDDSLEDTASSPVNSPKVSNFNQKYTMNRKQKEFAEIIQENTQNGTSTELQKRGLCLVPVSTVVDYLG